MNWGIASGVAETLRAEAVAAGALECCGLLLGRPGHIAAAVPARNVAADPARQFEIDPATLLRCHRDARAAGHKVVGHYHSHPNGRAEPSRTDAARALADGQIWVIVAGSEISGWEAISLPPPCGEGDAKRLRGGTELLHNRFRPINLASPA